MSRRRNHFKFAAAKVGLRKAKRCGVHKGRHGAQAGFNCVGVPQACQWIIGAVVKAAGAEERRTLYIFLSGVRIHPIDELACLHINAVSKIYVLGKLPCPDQSATGFLIDVGKAVLIKMDDVFDALVFQDQRLVSRVKIPDIVRDFLVVPFEPAGLGFEGE